MPDVTNGIFSDYCYSQMWELFKTPEDEVGSEFSGDKRGRSITNCIIYVSNVLIYGHEKIGRADRKADIEQIGKKEQDGIKLAKFLVGQIGWKAHYWNPDVEHPRDGGDEHPFSYKKALRTQTYYGIPLSGLIVDYNKQNKDSKTVWVPSPVIVPVLPITVPIPMPVTVPADNLRILERVSQVKFAFGIARGGYHTFLFSYGEVFEVHWNQEGAKLYGRTPFKDYEWLSGALIVPPDSSFTSDEIKAR